MFPSPCNQEKFLRQYPPFHNGGHEKLSVVMRRPVALDFELGGGSCQRGLDHRGFLVVQMLREPGLGAAPGFLGLRLVDLSAATAMSANTATRSPVISTKPSPTARK